jgi:hypothetical protein
MPDQHGCEDVAIAPATGRRALVVFEDRADTRLLRLLRPGFRHCFCVVGNGSVWTICDPLKSRIELTPIFGIGESELRTRLSRPGRTVLAGDVRIDGASRPLRLRALTCVEVVKRLLDLEAAWAITPYRLYHTLLGRREKGRFVLCSRRDDHP